MKTKLLTIAIVFCAACAQAELTFESLAAQAAALPARDYAGRWALLERASLLAARADQQLTLGNLQGDACFYGGHAAEAPGYYQTVMGLATDPSLRSVTAVKLCKLYLAAKNRSAAEALAQAEAASHPDDATAPGLQALLSETSAHDAAAWLAAAAWREQERQCWARLDHRWQWSALAARLRDLRQGGKSPAEINAIAIPLLTAGNVTYSPDFGACVALVNRVLLSRVDLRTHLQTLLQSVTATPDAESFRGILVAQLAALPPTDE